VYFDNLTSFFFEEKTHEKKMLLYCWARAIEPAQSAAVSSMETYRLEPSPTHFVFLYPAQQKGVSVPLGQRLIGFEGALLIGQQ